MSRTIVVTGGTSGIGLTIARRFAAEGDDVIVVGRHRATVIEATETTGGRGEVCDVTQPDAVGTLADRLPETVDVVIAMAGGNTDLANPHDTTGDVLCDTASAWKRNLEANTLSTVLTVTALKPKLRAGSSVIAVSSIGAEYAATSYGAAKAAVAAWIAGISAELAPSGVTANTISPGYIEDTNFFADSLTNERRERLIASTHTKRAGTPDDVAGLAFFLASPDARQITGQTIHVNGGAYVTR